MSYSAAHTQSGFTIIELVSVIVIISLLAVSVLLKNNTATMIDLGAQTQQVLNDIRFAQTLSMSKNLRFYFIKQSATTYQVLTNTGTPITFATGGTTMTLSTGITFGTLTNLPNNLIAFDGQGAPYTNSATPYTALTAANATIPLTDGTNTQTINITKNTGYLFIT